jgi:hypothetical protein
MIRDDRLPAVRVGLDGRFRIRAADLDAVVRPARDQF